MKLSCLPVSLFPALIRGDMSIAEWAQLGTEAGYDGIDLSILFFRNRGRINLAQTRKDIQSAGQRVVVTNTYPDLTHPDPAERQREFDQLQKDIATASELGTEMVRVTAGQAHPGVSRADGVAWAISGMSRSADTAQKHDVTLVYENHSKPGSWDYADFSWPADVFLEIARGLDSAGVRILFDTANPVAHGDDPIALLNEVIDSISCVHVTDTKTEGAMDWTLVGSGVVPLRDIFTALKASGYDGWMSIEEASGQGADGIRSAAQAAKEIWAQAG